MGAGRTVEKNTSKYLIFEEEKVKSKWINRFFSISFSH